LYVVIPENIGNKAVYYY